MIYALNLISSFKIYCSIIISRVSIVYMLKKCAIHLKLSYQGHP